MGLDAVAGVINIVMNNEFEGFKAEAQFGSDTEGFGSSNYTANAAYGTSFAGDRGHIMVGGSYFEQRQVCCGYSSPAGRDGLIPNPIITPPLTVNPKSCSCRTCSMMLASIGD